MKVTVTTLSDDIFVLDVSEDLELENFKSFCQIESGFPASEILIVHDGRPLTENKHSLKTLGIKDGDVVILQHLSSQGSQMSFNRPDQAVLPQFDFASIMVPGSSRRDSNPPPAASVQQRQSEMSDDPAHIRELFLANPDQLALLKQNNPRLADALATGSLDEFARVLRQQVSERRRRQEQRERIAAAHPFDVEAQRLIAEEIRQKNIEANMEAAMEYNPETFGVVTMLYINCRVNGYPVKAFIDSGAQTTIMSQACAERVNIMRLVDTRWAGIAKGVGVQRIIGRIHMVQVAIESDYLTTSFCILEKQPMDMLLGLDMLRRHQCCIDLSRNVLRIGTTGTETRFLPENELPSCARLHHTSSKEEDETMSLLDSLSGGNAAGLSLGAAAGGSLPTASGTQAQNTPQEAKEAEDKFPEQDIKDLVAYGFTREQVISELRRFNGDKMQATAALFAKSLKF